MAEETIQPIVERKNKKKSGFGFVVFLLIIALAAGLGWTYYQYYKAQQKIAYLSTVKAQQEIAQKEIDVTMAKISKHILLPAGEKPTVARIEDAKTLASQQAFFKGSSNGDQLLIFASSSKAIIYNPTKDVIVNVGPIFNEPQQNQAATDLPAQSVPSQSNPVQPDGQPQPKQ